MEKHSNVRMLLAGEVILRFRRSPGEMIYAFKFATTLLNEAADGVHRRSVRFPRARGGQYRHFRPGTVLDNRYCLSIHCLAAY